MVTAILLLLTGIGALLLRRRPQIRPLASTLTGLLAAYLLLALLVAPSLDPIMSPRAQAAVIADHVERGFRPLVFKVYPGTYAYYAGRVLPETRDPAMLRTHVAGDGPILIATARKYWERHADLLGAFELIHEQRIEGRPFVVAVRRALPTEEIR